MRHYFPEDLRDKDDREWDIYTSVYGIYLDNAATKQNINLRLNIPFLNWKILWTAVLPNDEIVFQLGNHICIYSCSENKIAVLAKGSSPIVFLENPINNQIRESSGSP